MWISLGIWQNQSLWNSFLIRFNVKDVLCLFDVSIITKLLSVKRVSEEKEVRHKIIIELHQMDFMTKKYDN